MKLILLLTLLLTGTFGLSMAQKKMNYESKTMSLTIPRVENNEAVVIISAPDIYQLSFESSLDKTVESYNTVKESGFNYYYLKFVVGDIYRGRKLDVKVEGYDKTTIPIPLNAKEVQSYYVYDPDGTVGVGCYFKNRNEGNDFFKRAMYSEAREKFNLALLCSDKPEDSDLQKRIEDIDMCIFSRRKADNLFGEAKFLESKDYYKEVLAINISDEYCQTRINDCDKEYANISRRVYGVLTKEDGTPLDKVSIKGAIKEKKNKYEVKETIGETKSDGSYDILVRQEYDVIRFSKTTYANVFREIPKDSTSLINIIMPLSNTTKGLNTGSSLLKMLNEANELVKDVKSK